MLDELSSSWGVLLFFIFKLHYTVVENATGRSSMLTGQYTSTLTESLTMDVLRKDLLLLFLSFSLSLSLSHESRMWSDDMPLA